jgi:DNA topoisomerase-1
MTTGVRPGSEGDTGAEKKAFGATTLVGDHVVVDGDSVRLKFVGKKGVNLDIEVADKATAKMLIERKREAGSDGQLFPINEKALLDHVHSFDGGGFKTKDFRTLLGTKTAADEVARAEAPNNQKEYKRAVMSVAKAVSARLGNTPVIALQSYINPAVFAVWRGDAA